MASKKNKFENAVNLSFYPSEPCYIIYSPNNKLSLKAKFSVLMPEDVKAKFGFELLCDDLSQSVKEAEAYRFKHDIPVSFPAELGKLTSYGIETNTLNLFVLHKISSKIGFTISTYSPLKKGTIIAEYVGEKKPLGIKIPDTTYVLINDDSTKIDAKDYGNAARFFHHCPHAHANKQVLTANLAAFPWPVSETSTKVFFVTMRDIKAFEPLCWDYGERYDFDHNVELLNAETYLPMVEFKGEL